MSTNVGAQDKRDQERVASMANEGGASGAHMDTREQMDNASGSVRSRRRIPWTWGAAAASAALGGVVLARTLVGKRRLRTSGSGAEAETEVEIESRGTRAPGKRKVAKGRRRTAVTQASAERGRGSPKRRRGGNDANVRKAGRGRKRAASKR